MRRSPATFAALTSISVTASTLVKPSPCLRFLNSRLKWPGPKQKWVTRSRKSFGPRAKSHERSLYMPRYMPPIHASSRHRINVPVWLRNRSLMIRKLEIKTPKVKSK